MDPSAIQNIQLPDAGPSPEIELALNDMVAAVTAIRTGAAEPDAATLGDLQAKAGRVLDALNADPSSDPDMMVAVTEFMEELRAMIADNQGDASYGGLNAGGPVPQGQVAKRRGPMSGELVGKSLTLGEVAEREIGASMATAWGRPERPNGVDFARAIAARATGHLG